MGDLTTPDERDAAAHELLDAFYAETTEETYYRSRRDWYSLDLRTVESGKRILASTSETQIRVLQMTLDRIDGFSAHDKAWQTLRRLVSVLHARRLPFSAHEVTRIVQSELWGNPPFTRSTPRFSYFLEPALRETIRYAEMYGLPDDLQVILVPYLDAMRQSRRDLVRLVDRLKELAGVAREGEMEDGEPWIAAIRSSLDTIDTGKRDCWYALFALGTRAEGTKPSGAWRQQVAAHVEAIGPEMFKQWIIAWFPLLDAPATVPLDDRNSLILRGLAWACIPLDDIDVSRALGGLAEAMFRKIPGQGPRSRKVANACLYALSLMPGTEPIVQLSRLSLRIKGTQAQGDIGRAIEAAALRIGLPREEIEEITVPTYGLDTEGIFRQMIGGYTAEIRIVGSTSVELCWLTREGKPQKSLPTAVKTGHADELKAVRTVHGEIRKMLPAQRDRLERLLIADRSWDVATWRERYADHPLLSQMTRRLIWHFQPPVGAKMLGIHYNGWLVDLHERPLDPLPEGTQVRLWHPLGFDPEIVLRWRAWLEERTIAQPFKQAHREIYLLTDAELATGTYSNRFAAHIIRQHQFNALCSQRDWAYLLQYGYDGSIHTCATRNVPGWNARVEFWVDAGGEMSDGGAFLYLSTDQVRFRNLDNTNCPLSEVPAQVFSEVMRDVDLFVGVTSIGNIPDWQDGGDDRYEYWRGYAFGDLSASAESRRDVLARLLPRLKIAPQCIVRDRFLVVRGALRTYKIHLGSGNILMEPNDQYLCIVPSRGEVVAGKADNVGFLPFEGDAMLSLILSKAFLLADDTRIADPTIRRQIEPHSS